MHQISKSQIRIFYIDATAISEEIYGKTSIPITNIAMLGAFVSVSGVVHLDSILDVVDQFFSGDGAEKAKRSAQDAYARMEQIRSQPPHEGKGWVEGSISSRWSTKIPPGSKADRPTTYNKVYSPDEAIVFEPAPPEPYDE